MQISKEKIEQYNQEGYTIVENVFSKNELKPVLDELNHPEMQTMYRRGILWASR